MDDDFKLEIPPVCVQQLIIYFINHPENSLVIRPWVQASKAKGRLMCFTPDRRQFPIEGTPLSECLLYNVRPPKEWSHVHFFADGRVRLEPDQMSGRWRPVLASDKPGNKDPQ